MICKSIYNLYVKKKTLETLHVFVNEQTYKFSRDQTVISLAVHKALIHPINPESVIFITFTFSCKS